MSLRKTDARISEADYLEGEKENPIRHEYIDGHIYAMAGSSDRHNRIAINITSRLNDNLTSGPCETFMSDMKVRVNEKTYYYPDIVVACDPPGSDHYIRSQPVLIVEVTSPTTSRIDQHEKLLAYRNIPSLHEYVLVAQDQMRIETHRRRGQDWEIQVYTLPEDVLQLESTGLSMALKEVYRNVTFESA